MIDIEMEQDEEKIKESMMQIQIVFEIDKNFLINIRIKRWQRLQNNCFI